ncbi:hypothetical protein L226DRAFT_549658 [Lentinus tigrinus ALCF2SS1-7]|uniref:non-specific serine/threonine protein kinase n=1 Tax=Lentinus tigrinus ALCF2SS1-6 TaxID=1328759 RepID=A0A5C2SST8_9APHY|nr:hypothetical protein L227DRAFT_589909 [Lentinus tigrinus ALCF2SS1-6]RPD80907.1 hypothetical protein L226DRAFT_549658 [Lentinus tigrinus ALCF2SS1-7]
MLGTRTKQVFSYGRRGHRVVNVYDDYDRAKPKEASLSSTKAENDVPSRLISNKSIKDSPISTKTNFTQDDSPIRTKKTRKSPKIAKIGKLDVAKPMLRYPLGSLAPNAPGSPAVPPPLRAKRRVNAVKAAPLTPSSPIVKVDIEVVDAQGRRVSREHRISRADVQANVLAPATSVKPVPRTKAMKKKQAEAPIVVSSDGEEDPSLARRPETQRIVASSKLAKPVPRARAVRGKQASPVIVLSSDDEDSLPRRPKRTAKSKVQLLVISDDEDDSGSDWNPMKDASDEDTSIEEPALRTPRLRRGLQRTRSNVVRSPSPTPSLSPPSTPSTTPPSDPGPSKVQLATPPAAAPNKVPSSKLPTSTAAPPAPITRHATLPSHLSRPQTLVPFSSLPEFELDEESGPSRSKPRKLTPIRARPGRAIFPAPPSPPSPTTFSEIDLDVTFDFAQLALSPRALAEVKRLDAAAGPSVPAYVRPLLDECAQSTPHEFSAFIEMFPHDPIVRSRTSTSLPTFQKIGEASYSEVFGIGDVVLKIIPLRDEERTRPISMDVDGPAPSDAKDVLKEIIVTRAMGETCTGFVELLRTYVVRGKYPSLLLDLWDEYDERKGSESVRPDTFTVSQLYAIIVLPNGGPDLEAYSFNTPSKTGWRQACSIFWQVTRTLAEAEDLVSFEHRDLHWGQILVKNVPAKSTSRRKTRTSMDDLEHGVLVTIIDLGLARMDSHDNVGNSIHWTPFDEETFEGEGDYQFDMYRLMRTHNGDEWEEFRPLTNVMWLHYLVLKLLQSKRLRPPAVARKSSATQSASGFSERECYECLKETEAVLAQCLASVKTAQTAKKGRRKTVAPGKAGKVKDPVGPKSAGELLDVARSRGWVR